MSVTVFFFFLLYFIPFPFIFSYFVWSFLFYFLQGKYVISEIGYCHAAVGVTSSKCLYFTVVWTHVCESNARNRIHVCTYIYDISKERRQLLDLALISHLDHAHTEPYAIYAISRSKAFSVREKVVYRRGVTFTLRYGQVRPSSRFPIHDSRFANHDARVSRALGILYQRITFGHSAAGWTRSNHPELEPGTILKLLISYIEIHYESRPTVSVIKFREIITWSEGYNWKKSSPSACRECYEDESCTYPGITFRKEKNK